MSMNYSPYYTVESKVQLGDVFHSLPAREMARLYFLPENLERETAT